MPKRQVLGPNDLNMLLRAPFPLRLIQAFFLQALFEPLQLARDLVPVRSPDRSGWDADRACMCNTGLSGYSQWVHIRSTFTVLSSGRT